MGRVLEALAHMFLAHQGVRQARWNLVVTYEYWCEYWSRHLLSGRNMKFLKGSLGAIIDVGWALQLQ